MPVSVAAVGGQPITSLAEVGPCISVKSRSLHRERGALDKARPIRGARGAGESSERVIGRIWSRITARLLAPSREGKKIMEGKKGGEEERVLRSFEPKAHRRSQRDRWLSARGPKVGRKLQLSRGCAAGIGCSALYRERKERKFDGFSWLNRARQLAVVT